MTLPGRKFSPCLLRYVTAGFAIPFIGALLGFLAIFIIVDVLNDINNFSEHQVPFAQTALFFLAKQPPNLTNIIPISILLGASFMTLMMGRHNELTAMRAAGLSLMSCALPVWIISLASCAVVFAINESWGASCAKFTARIEANYLERDTISQSASFYHPKELRDWTIDKLSKKGTSERVTVRQFRADGSTDFLIVAQRASFSEGNGWIFEDGYIQHYNQDGTVKGEVFEHIRKDFTESPQTIATYSVNWSIMNLKELANVLKDDIIASQNILLQIRTVFWHKIFFPLASIVAALFGVALTISTDRVGGMKGFACSVAIVVLYYVAGQFFLQFAQRGWLPPFVGGAMPSLLFLIAGICTMWKKS